MNCPYTRLTPKVGQTRRRFLVAPRSDERYPAGFAVSQEACKLEQKWDEVEVFG
jgi:hypothetical protein